MSSVGREFEFTLGSYVVGERSTRVKAIIKSASETPRDANIRISWRFDFI